MRYIGTIIGIIFILIVLFVSHDTEQRHEHILYEVPHKNWKFNYTATICLTDSAQVTQSGKHYKTKLAEDYFN